MSELIEIRVHWNFPNNRPEDSAWDGTTLRAWPTPCTSETEICILHGLNQHPEGLRILTELQFMEEKWRAAVQSGHALATDCVELSLCVRISPPRNPSEIHILPDTPLCWGSQGLIRVAGGLAEIPNKRFRQEVLDFPCPQETGSKSNLVIGNLFHAAAGTWLLTDPHTTPASRTSIVQHFDQTFRQFTQERPREAAIGIHNRLKAWNLFQHFCGAEGVEKRRASQHKESEIGRINGFYGIPYKLDYADQNGILELKTGKRQGKYAQQAYIYGQLLGHPNLHLGVKTEGEGYSLEQLQLDADSRMHYGRLEMGAARDYAHYLHQVRLERLARILIPGAKYAPPTQVQLSTSTGQKPKLDQTGPSCSTQAFGEGKDCAKTWLRPLGPFNEISQACQFCASGQRLWSEPKQSDLKLQYITQLRGFIERQRWIEDQEFAHLWDRSPAERQQAMRSWQNLQNARLWDSELEPIEGYSSNAETWILDTQDTHGADFDFGQRLYLFETDPDNLGQPKRDPLSNVIAHSVVFVWAADTLQGGRILVQKAAGEGLLNPQALYQLEIAHHNENTLAQARALGTFARRESTLDQSLLSPLPLPNLVPPEFTALWHKFEHQVLNAVWGAEDSPQGIAPARRQALKDLVSCPSYFLLQGPPGTGKTFVIALATLFYLFSGQDRIRIGTFTKLAAQNILRQFADLIWGHSPSDAQQSQRLAQAMGYASPAQLCREFAWTSHPNSDPILARFEHRELFDLQGLDRDALELRRAQIEQYWQGCRVLIGTVNSTRSAALDLAWQEKSTLALVDEASQLTEAGSLVGVLDAYKFVLIGDEKQLAPVAPDLDSIASAGPLQNSFLSLELPKNAQDILPMRRLDTSLFERLLQREIKHQGSAHEILCENRRCAPAIWEFPSLYYLGGRKTVTAVREHEVPQPTQSALSFLDPLVEFGVFWTPSETPTAAKHSHQQALKCRELVENWIQSGISPQRIAVLTPFNAQKAELQRTLGHWAAHLEAITTIDRYQGRENDYILISLCGAGASLAQGMRLCPIPLESDAEIPTLAAQLGIAQQGLLWVDKKLNVALTRAKRKCALVVDPNLIRSQTQDSEATLAYRKHLAGFFGYLESKTRAPLQDSELWGVGSGHFWFEGPPPVGFARFDPHSKEAAS